MDNKEIKELNEEELKTVAGGFDSGDDETLESALRRFKRSAARDGILPEERKREHHEKPSVKRKKKSEAARKRKY